MSEKLKELLKESFTDLAALTPEKLRVISEETMKYFMQMQERLNSQDPAVREKALMDSQEIRKLLEEKMLALCELNGLDPAQLAAYADEAIKNSPQDKAIIEEVKEKIHSMKKPASKHHQGKAMKIKG